MAAPTIGVCNNAASKNLVIGNSLRVTNFDPRFTYTWYAVQGSGSPFSSCATPTPLPTGAISKAGDSCDGSLLIDTALLTALGITLPACNTVVTFVVRANLLGTAPTCCPVFGPTCSSQLTVTLSSNYSLTTNDPSSFCKCDAEINVNYGSTGTSSNVSAACIDRIDLFSGDTVSTTTGTPIQTITGSNIGATKSVFSDLCPGLYVVRITDLSGTIYQGCYELRGQALSTSTTAAGNCCDGRVTVSLLDFCSPTASLASPLRVVLVEKQTDKVLDVRQLPTFLSPRSASVTFDGLCPGCYTVQVFKIEEPSVSKCDECCDHDPCKRITCDVCEQPEEPVCEIVVKKKKPCERAQWNHDNKCPHDCTPGPICSFTVRVASSRSLTIDYDVKKPCGCGFDCDGIITLRPYGGSGNFEFADSRSGIFTKSPVFKDLCPGKHRFIVRDLGSLPVSTDNCDCLPACPPETISGSCKEIEIDLDACGGSTGKGEGNCGCKNDLEIVAIEFKRSCDECDDLKVFVKADGGHGNYWYSLDGGEFQDYHVFENVAEGHHTVEVLSFEDANDCPTETKGKFLKASKDFKRPHRVQHRNNKLLNAIIVIILLGGGLWLVGWALYNRSKAQ